MGRLSYLVDSNVWLELLLEQQRAEEVRQFLLMVQLNEINLTDLILVSFDHDFDATDLKRKTPSKALAQSADYN